MSSRQAPEQPTQHLGFTSLHDETTIEHVPVTGTIPAWLSGTLVRNGPAQFAVGDRQYHHWFDGLGMLHAFTFQGGEVRYANKFLASNAYTRAKETGRISYPEFATDPCRSLFGKMFAFLTPASNNANVSVTRIAGRYLALTETPMPVEFDPETLATLGPLAWQDQVKGQVTTAHMHTDPATGETFNYVAHMGPTSAYHIYRIAPGSRQRQLVGSIPVRRPGYMHSFALTEHHVILAEFPLVVNPIHLGLRLKPFIQNYRWQPQRGTRFLVLDRRDGRLVGTYKAPACFAFHHINAFEDGDTLVLDLAAYDDPGLIDLLYLDHVDRFNRSGEVRRYRIPLHGAPVSCERIGDVELDLPTINYARCNTRPYRYVYGPAPVVAGAFGFGRLVKLDLATGASLSWEAEGCHPAEGVFVPTPGGEAEDDGVILSVVLDGRKGASFLLVLDAASFSELGRAEVPHHVPFGFHGQYFGRA